jgi:hypothetical protein
VLAGNCEILDGNIKVPRHLLVAGPGRPRRLDVLRLGLERQAGPPSGERSFTQPGSSCSTGHPSSRR